jgi:hypothetical protein
MIRLILIAGQVTRKPVSGVCSLATNYGMYTIVFGGRALVNLLLCVMSPYGYT